MADDFTFVDHRPLGSDSMGPDEYVEFLEALIAETADFLYESVRTLAMSPAGGVDVVRLFGHTVDGAAFEFVFVRVTVANRRGLTAMEVFPLEDEAAALARFAEFQKQAGSTANVDDDLEAFRSMLAEDCVLVDHRLLAAEPMDRDAYVAYFAALLEETSDVSFERLELLAESHDRMVELDRFAGHTKDDVEFETLFLRVAILRDGLFVRMEIFPPEDREAALARFQELRADPTHVRAVERPQNRATDALGRAQGLYEARDWEALKAMAPPDFLFSDRRHLAQVTSDRDGWIHSSKLMASASAEEDRTILSVLGDRLALYQSLWTAQVEGAPLVVESLGLCEVDDRGRFVELLHFDLEQRREANDELWDRFQGTEEGQTIPSIVYENRRAFNDHDLVALRATLHDDLVFDDHRRTGTGELDAEGYVESVAALLRDTEDLVGETIHRLASDEFGSLVVGHMVGRNRGGGDFESQFLRVVMSDREKLTRIEVFEIDDLDAAMARFDELAGAETVVGEGSRLSNAATRAMDRWIAALEARDRDAMIAGVAASFVYDDRRSLTGVALDRAEWISTQDISLATGLRVRSTTLSILGDRLAMAHERWHGESEGAAFDGENLTIREVDAEGRTTAIVTFDTNDRQAASDDLLRRFRTSEEGRVLPPVVFDAVHAVNHRNAAGLRATMGDDFEAVDHRSRGVERMGADEYTAFFDSLVSETSDSAYESVRLLRTSPAGAVNLVRMPGHTRDGGAFEFEWAAVTIVRNERLVMIELFSPEEADLAVARFDELTGDHGQ